MSPFASVEVVVVQWVVLQCRYLSMYLFVPFVASLTCICGPQSCLASEGGSTLPKYPPLQAAFPIAQVQDMSCPNFDVCGVGAFNCKR